jgi:hypothetical protein
MWVYTHRRHKAHWRPSPPHKIAEENKDDMTLHNHQNCLDPLLADTRNKRHTDVSQDPRYIHQSLTGTDYDAECTTAPYRITPWVLPTEETHALFQGGHGTTPDLIYAKGVPDNPDPGITSFDKKLCTSFSLRMGSLKT